MRCMWIERALFQNEGKKLLKNRAKIEKKLDVDNLEVKEQGVTRILLTASSNQIEVHDLKKESLRYSQTPGARGRGQGRGRGRNMMRQINTTTSQDTQVTFGPV